MTRLALIGLAGAIGALCRYGLQGWVNSAIGRPTVLGTFVVNISGAFLLGLLVALSEDRGVISPQARTIASIGFLGAYTTFSTFMFESVDRLETGDLLVAFANIGGSVIFGLSACYLGLVVGRNA